MSQKITVADAFTDRPYRGNPAAVVVLERAREEAWMRDLAREMNLSETAFLVPRADGFDLRWFTPAVEVELCGHATLASAHVLWTDGRLASDAVARFHTKSGLLSAARRGAWIELDFPATQAQPSEAPPGLFDALGAVGSDVRRSKFDYLVAYDDEATVRALRPDFARLRTLPVRGIIATARASVRASASNADAARGLDVVSRFFAPGSGIDEDPVTGSAHCALGPYWAEKLAKDDLVCFQASQRGGTVRVGVRGERVLLAGQAVTVWRGELVAE